jgi:hypothetical protein
MVQERGMRPAKREPIESHSHYGNLCAKGTADNPEGLDRQYLEDRLAARERDRARYVRELAPFWLESGWAVAWHMLLLAGLAGR